jgi:hypothetical protein
VDYPIYRDQKKTAAAIKNIDAALCQLMADETFCSRVNQGAMKIAKTKTDTDSWRAQPVQSGEEMK